MSEEKLDSLLLEFTERIVKPYFKGDLKEALETLMLKALQDEELLQNHLISRRAIHKTV